MSLQSKEIPILGLGLVFDKIKIGGQCQGYTNNGPRCTKQKKNINPYCCQHHKAYCGAAKASTVRRKKAASSSGGGGAGVKCTGITKRKTKCNSYALINNRCRNHLRFKMDRTDYNPENVMGLEGSYRSYIDFLVDKKGFVVQHIQKDIVEQNDFLKVDMTDEEWSEETNPKEYWEIFEINTHKGTHLSSKHSDGFVQAGMGPKSSGKIVQMGTSLFYPSELNLNEFINKCSNKDTIGINKVKAANTLSASYTEIKPDNIQAYDVKIIRETTVNWKKHQYSILKEKVTINGHKFPLLRPETNDMVTISGGGGN